MSSGESSNNGNKIYATLKADNEAKITVSWSAKEGSYVLKWLNRETYDEQTTVLGAEDSDAISKIEEWTGASYTH
jgi:hypothetical protein